MSNTNIRSKPFSTILFEHIEGPDGGKGKRQINRKKHVHLCVYECACVHAYMPVCVCACVRVCACMRVPAYNSLYGHDFALYKYFIIIIIHITCVEVVQVKASH